MFLRRRAEENAKEVALLHEVWAPAQGYGEFLDKGTPVCFDVPGRPATVVSGLLLGWRLLVRRTDFGENDKPVILSVGGKEVTVERGEGCRMIEASSRPVHRPDRREGHQPLRRRGDEGVRGSVALSRRCQHSRGHGQAGLKWSRLRP